MKKITLFIFFTAFFAACSNSTDNSDNAASKDSIPAIQDSSSAAVLFNETEEEALHDVSKVPEINKELNRTFPDTSVHNALVLVQPATPEDPNHYVQLMEMHPENGVTLMHFRVDAISGEIRVMDPLAEEETWISLDKWRQTKL
jgi:hypothetical protein